MRDMVQITHQSKLPESCPARVWARRLTLRKLGCGTNDDPLHGLLHGILPHAPLQHVDELHSHSRDQLRSERGVSWATVVHLLVSPSVLRCCWHWQMAADHQVYQVNKLLVTAKALEERSLSAWGIHLSW